MSYKAVIDRVADLEHRVALLEAALARVQKPRVCDTKPTDDAKLVFNEFNAMRKAAGMRQVQPSSARYSMINARLRDYGRERVVDAMHKFFDPRYWWRAHNRCQPELLFRSVGQFEKVENSGPYDPSEWHDICDTGTTVVWGGGA